MSKKIDLPGDLWALILDADEVTERSRRAYLTAQGKMADASGITVDADGKADTSKMDAATAVSSMGDVHDALILCHLKEWNLTDADDVAVPIGKDVTLEALIDLPAQTYSELLAACQEVSKGLALDTSAEGALDPESPTDPLAE